MATSKQETTRTSLKDILAAPLTNEETQQDGSAAAIQKELDEQVKRLVTAWAKADSSYSKSQIKAVAEQLSELRAEAEEKWGARSQASTRHPDKVVNEPIE